MRNQLKPESAFIQRFRLSAKTYTFAFLALLAVVLAGCKGEQSTPTGPAPSVSVAQVIEREITEWDEFTGRLEAVEKVARYAKDMHGPWRWIYVVTACAALYFNVFVLVVQSFLKVPTLHSLAPTQAEPPFAIAQGIVLVVFIALTVVGVKRFKVEPLRRTASASQ